MKIILKTIGIFLKGVLSKKFIGFVIATVMCWQKVFGNESWLVWLFAFAIYCGGNVIDKLIELKNGRGSFAKDLSKDESF